MRMIQFEVIDEQGNRERDIYINPGHVRSVSALQAYGKNQRTRISFGADDNVLVRGTADEVVHKLQEDAKPPAAEAPTLRVVEPK